MRSVSVAPTSFVPEGGGRKWAKSLAVLALAGSTMLAIQHLTRNGEEIKAPKMPDIRLCGSSNIEDRAVTKAACNTAAAVCCSLNLKSAGKRLTPGQRACLTHFNPPEDAPLSTCMTTCQTAVISCGEVFGSESQ